MKILVTLICIPIIVLIQEAYGQSISSNKEVITFYFEEVANQKKIDQLDKVFADSFLRHDLNNGTQRTLTIEQQKEGLESLFNAFPDIHFTIGDLIEEGDRVVARVITTATHKGEFQGYTATGNRIDYLSEIFFFRLEKGKVVERWVHIDWYNLYKYLEGEN